MEETNVPPIISETAFKRERKRTQELVIHLRARRKQLPTGTLVLKNGSYFRAVAYEGKRQQIIISPGFNGRETLIEELQEKRYIDKALPLLEHNLDSYSQLLQQICIYDPMMLKASLPGCYQDFPIKTLLLAGDIDPCQWKNDKYESNAAFPHDLIYKSEEGLLTRSKAEAEIATKLEQYGLAFRYEPALILGNHKFFPDFCALHVQTRRPVYWEHMGKMDDHIYVNHNMDKLRIYGEHGLRLGDNLIVTWETKESPLTFDHINDRIRQYLL